MDGNIPNPYGRFPTSACFTIGIANQYTCVIRDVCDALGTGYGGGRVPRGPGTSRMEGVPRGEPLRWKNKKPVPGARDQNTL